MEACNFPESNSVLGPPQGLTEEEVYSLNVWQGLNSDKIPITISCWKLTQEEIDHLLKGGRLWLHIFGGGMPPVGLTTQHPFME